MTQKYRVTSGTLFSIAFATPGRRRGSTGFTVLSVAIAPGSPTPPEHDLTGTSAAQTRDTVGDGWRSTRTTAGRCAPESLGPYVNGA